MEKQEIKYIYNSWILNYPFNTAWKETVIKGEVVNTLVQVTTTLNYFFIFQQKNQNRI